MQSNNQQNLTYEEMCELCVFIRRGSYVAILDGNRAPRVMHKSEFLEVFKQSKTTVFKSNGKPLAVSAAKVWLNSVSKKTVAYTINIPDKPRHLTNSFGDNVLNIAPITSG